MQAHLRLPEPPLTPPSPFGPPRQREITPRLVIGVIYTGLRRSRVRWEALFDPPLERALNAILANMELHASQCTLMRAIAKREPPALQESIVLLAANKDGGRWPVAYLTADAGELDFPALQDALRAIGGL